MADREINALTNQEVVKQGNKIQHQLIQKTKLSFQERMMTILIK